jgi:farnesyl diphosphate synthase
MAQATTLKEFESIFPKLVEDILTHARQYNLPEDFANWYYKVGIASNLGFNC